MISEKKRDKAPGLSTAVDIVEDAVAKLEAWAVKNYKAKDLVDMETKFQALTNLDPKRVWDWTLMELMERTQYLDD